MELERLQVVIEASLGDFKKKMNAVKGIVNNATSQVKAETDKIKYSMDNMTGKVKTANIDKLRDKIKSTNADIAAMYARMDEMKTSKYAEMSEMPYNEVQLDTAVENVLSKDKAYQKLSDSIRKAEQELERYKVTLSETNALQESGSNKSNRLAGIFDRVKSSLSRAKGQANSFKKNLKGIDLAAIPLSKSIFKLSTMFKLMALRMVMRAAINAIKSGFQDLAKYSSNFNGTMSQISSVLLQARNSLATAFAPALQALIPIINSVTNAFINAFNTIGMFIARLFGGATTFTKAKKVSTDYAKSLGGVDKAAKKAGGSLASFDEINVLAQDAGGNEDTGMPAATDMFEEVAISDESISAIDKFKNKINELIEPLKNINFENLINAFGRLKEAITPFTNMIFAGLEWAYLNILVPWADWSITQLLPKYLDILAGVLNVLNGVLDALKPLGMWLWDNFLQPLAKWTGGKIVGVLSWISEKLRVISDWIQDNKPVIQDISIIVGSFATAWLLVTGALKAWNAVVLIWNSIGVIATAVTGAFGAAVAFLTSPVGIVIIAIGAVIAIVVLLVKHWDKVKAVAISCWEKIKEVWGAVADWFNRTVVTPVIEFFTNMGVEFSKIIDGIKVFFINAFINMGEKVNNLITFFKGLISYITGAFKTG